MTYRTPVVVGDRVALAPHTDLWMRGARFGTVEEKEHGIYLVRVGDGDAYAWLSPDDLLGAVAGTPVGGVKQDQSATRSSVAERAKTRAIEERDRYAEQVEAELRGALEGWGQ